MMKKVISLLAAFCLVLSGSLLCGCESYDNFKKTLITKEEEPAPDPEEDVLIGIFEPLSGSDAEAAADEVRGIELACSLYPEVLGRKVQLVYGDNCSDDTTARETARSLTEQGVSVVLGSYRNVLAMAAADVFKETRTPAIAVTCSNPLITKNNPYYCRACIIDTYQGESAAVYALSREKHAWFTVFMEDGDDYSATMAEQFISKVAQRVGNDYSVAVITYPGSTADFSLYLEKLEIMRTGPIFFPSDAQTGESVLWQAASLGYRFDWVGCSKWESLADAARTAGRDSFSHLDGAAFVADYDVNEDISPMTEIFRNAYAKAYGQDAAPTKAAALGFDAYLLALEAIRQAGRSDAGTLIANKLSNITDFTGATGTITMDSNGDPMKDVVIDVYRDGVYSAACTVSPNTGEQEE